MRRPSILFLSQLLPFPLDSGAKVRSYHVIRWLAERADVHLAAFIRDDDTPEAVRHLRSISAGVYTVPMRRSRLTDAFHFLRTFTNDTPLVIARDTSPAMQALVRLLGATNTFDAAHADQLWMAQYGRLAKAAYRVLDDHNAVHLIFERMSANTRSTGKRWLFAREARRLATYEAAQLDAFDRVIFVSERDRQAITALVPEGRRAPAASRTAVIPICIDVGAMRPVEVNSDARRVTVLGTLHWPPNADGVLWLGEHVIPRVLASIPDACFTIIGKNAPPGVLALAERFGSAVEIMGYVVDPRPYLAQTAVFAVPLLVGGGMRVKILEAWARGLPVVSTSIGAEGINVDPEVNILIGDTPEAFADATIELLGDSARRAALGRAGRQTVQAQYDVQSGYDALEKIYGPILDPSSRPVFEQTNQSMRPQADGETRKQSATC